MNRGFRHMDNNMVAKVLLLGRTKAGKSSFINCFLGKKVAQAGGGKPITPTFKEYKDDSGRYPIAIYDSKGIEACEADNQIDDIIEYVKKQNNSDNVFDWFHTIFYCVAMDKARFQDFEANFIKKLRKEIGQHIHIILTHCDGKSPKTIQNMRELIEKKLGDMSNIRIFETVCASKEKANGEVIKPQGIEAISESVFELFLSDIADKISRQYAKELDLSLRGVAYEIYNEANELVDDTVRFKTLIQIIQDEEKLNKILNDKTEELEGRIEEKLGDVDKRFKDILKPIGELYMSYRQIVTVLNDNFAEDMELSFSDVFAYQMDGWFDKADEKYFNEGSLYRELTPFMYKHGIIDENGDIKENDEDWKGIIKVANGMIIDLLGLKINCKKFIYSVYNDFLNNIPRKSKLQKDAYNRIVECFIEQWNQTSLEYGNKYYNSGTASDYTSNLSVAYCGKAKELGKAIKDGVDVIIIKGDLIKSVKRIMNTSGVKWGICVASLTASITLVLNMPVAAFGGIVGDALYIAAGTVTSAITTSVLGYAAVPAILIGVGAGGIVGLNNLREKYKITEEEDDYIRIEKKKK
jgi:GTP-binding protein EngB required for normal cell division